jgi:RNA polymerase sigma factor for flagellar operon FliA
MVARFGWGHVMSPEREREIVRWLPLVQSIVNRFAKRLPPQVDRGDIFQAGVIGLMQAVDRFDTTRGNVFTSYAVPYIRGAILDELRDRDWVTRGAHERFRKRRQSDANAHLIRQVRLSLESNSVDAENNNVVLDDPSRIVEKEEVNCVLLREMTQLKERYKTIIRLYFFEGYLLKDIAEQLGVTTSCIRLTMITALRVLRCRLVKAGMTRFDIGAAVSSDGCVIRKRGRVLP